MTDGEGILINDEARMTNAEGMTKSESHKPGNADDSFRNEDAQWGIREQPEKNRVYDLEERTARNKAFPSQDCSGRARAEGASTRVVDGSQGAAFDLLKNLERP